MPNSVTPTITPRIQPDTWEIITLDDVGEWVGGGTPSKSKSAFWTGGTIPWVSPKDMKRDFINSSVDMITDIAVAQSSAKLIKENSVLVVTRSGIIERILPVAINTAEVTVNQDIKALVPYDEISSKFVFYFLRANDQLIREMCSKTGTTVASVDLPKLKKYQIGLPPKNEQTRIVAAIESLQQRSNRARTLLSDIRPRLDILRQSILQAAFSGRLTADWRAKNPDVEPADQLLARIRAERRQRWESAELEKFKAKGKKPPKHWQDKYKEPEPVDEEGVPELPEGWCWVNMDQLSYWSMYGPRFSNDLYGNSGARVLRTTDFSEDGSIDLSSPPQIQLDEETLSKYIVEQGDLLITRTGSLGTLAVFPGGEDAIAGAFLIHYKLLKSVELSWWIFNFLRGPRGQGGLVEGGAGTGRPNLNMPRINSIPIPIAPADEQSKILEVLKKGLGWVTSVEEIASEALNTASDLDQSILSKAFRGELLPQDPNDEPASELLARIHASREAQATKAKSGKKKTGKMQAKKKAFSKK